MPVVPVPAGVATIPLEPLQLPGGEFGLPVAEPFPFPEKKAPLPLVVFGDRAPPPLPPEPELLPFEDQGGEMGDLGEELECDPGEVILICAQLLARLSSLGVLSTVILGIRPSMERERTPIPTGEGERDRRRPEKLVPLVVLVRWFLCTRLTFWKLEKLSKLKDLVDRTDTDDPEETEDTPEAKEWLEDDCDNLVME